MLGFFYAQKQVLAMKDHITVFSIYIIEKKNPYVRKSNTYE